MTFNIIVDAISFFVAVIAIYHVNDTSRNKFVCRIYRNLLICLLMILPLDLLTWIIDGKIFYGSIVLKYSCVMILFISEILYEFYWFMYLDYWNNTSKDKTIRNSKYYFWAVFIQILLVLSTPITKIMFYYDDNGVYHRGKLFFFNMIIILALVFGTLGITLYNYLKSSKDIRKNKRQKNFVLLSCLALPVFGCIMQFFNYGFSLLGPFSVLSLLIILLYDQQDVIMRDKLESAKESLHIAEAQKKLTESKIDVIVSQIQPQFLYTSLDSIKTLCNNNPQAASIVITDFSKYLRMNMDSLSEKKPILFLREIEHVKSYMAIEQLNCPEMKINYSLALTDFRIPSLTVLVLVESCKDKKISISTYDDRENIYLVISSSASSFNEGIEMNNVRERLSRMVEGTLKIQSIDNGIRAIVTLPKILRKKEGV